MVSVNDFGSYYATSLPFGGKKGSGYGRFGGEEGLRALCNVKAVCEDAWWARLVGVRTRIPGRLRYPILDEKAAWGMGRGLVELGYGVGWRGRWEGVRRLVEVVMGRGGGEMAQGG